MRCRVVKKRITEYLEGGLSEDQQSDIGKHIEDCPKCRELSRQLQNSREKLSSLKEPPHLSDKTSKKILHDLKHEFVQKEPAGRLSIIFGSRRAIAFAGTAAAVLALVVIVGGITLKMVSTEWGRSARDVTTLETKTAGTATEDESKSISEKAVEGTVPADANMATVKPVPEVKVTGTDYTVNTLQNTIATLEPVKGFSKSFTMSDAINLKKKYTTLLVDGFTNLGENGELLRSMIGYITTGETALLPCYVEKALFNGQNAIILCLMSPTRSGKSVKLTRVEIWVLNPEKYVNNPDSSILNSQQFKLDK